MSLVPSAVRAVLVAWSVAATVSASSASASTAEAEQEAEQPARVSPWPCRLIAVPTVRPVVQKGMDRSATIRRQCQELAAARAVVVLEWGAMDSYTQARTAMEVRAGVVVASVKLPPLGDIIVLMAHELQHVIEQTRGLDLRAEAQRTGSGVWQSFGAYETQGAVDVSRQVEEELRAYSKAARRRPK
jgi:hypothetical protein